MGAVHLLGGELGHYLTQRRWAEAYLRTNCHFDPSSRLATIDMGRKLGAPPLLVEGELGPHLARCGLGRDLSPCQVASWSIQPSGHNRHGPKTGGRALFRGLGPHLTQRRLAEAYLDTKCHLDPSSRLATIDMGRKLGGSAPFWGGELGAHSAQCGLRQDLSPCQVAEI